MIEHKDHPEITRKQIEQICLNWQDGRWANLTLEDNGAGRGRITITSDWGSWATGWGAMGDTLKGFLIGMGSNVHYIKENLHGRPADYFYQEETHKAVDDYFRSHMGEDYDHPIDCNESPKWDVEEFFDLRYDSANSYLNALAMCTKEWVEEFHPVDNPPPCITGYPPALNRFVEFVWPIFIKELKDEKRRAERKVSEGSKGQ